MTVRLITGLNGSGKTLFTISEIEKYHAEYPDREIYTNIAGLKFDYCKIAPNDWRDTPIGSLLVYDEAQEPHLFPSTGHAGNSTDPRIISVATHRKTNHDIWLITPKPTLVHHHLRSFVKEHYHLFNPMGIHASTVLFWERVSNQPDDHFEKQSADQRVFHWPKRLFEKYESAQVHTKKKFRIPIKVMLVLAFVLSVIIFICWAWWTGKIFFLPSPGQTDEKPQLGYDGKPKEDVSAMGAFLGQKPKLAYQDRFIPEVPHEPWSAKAYENLQPLVVPEIICASSEDRCQCYTEQMTKLKIIETKCRDIALNGIYNPFKQPYQPVVSTKTTPSDSNQNISKQL